MISARFFVVFVSFVWAAHAAQVLNQHNPFYAQSNGDITSYLQDPVKMRQEINCVLNKGYCDDLGKNLKLAIPEVVIRNCASCTPQQAANARKLVAFLNQNYPGVMGQIARLYNRQPSKPTAG